MKKLFFFLLFLRSLLGVSQTISSSLDKNQLGIGETAQLIIRIDGTAGKDVFSAPKNELLPFHFEESRDSISHTPTNYQRSINFAIFAEGKFTIPKLQFKVGDRILSTAPIDVTVVNTSTPKDRLNDIMNNKEVQLSLGDYWELYKWYVYGALILLALVFVIYQLLKFGKKRKSAPVVATNSALKKLRELEKKNYIQAHDYRNFYVELVEIIREFLKVHYGFPSDVLLTEDLINFMVENNAISQENEAVVADILQRGDMVKFAKILPEQDQMQNDLSTAKDFIKNATKDINPDNYRADV